MPDYPYVIEPAEYPEIWRLYHVEGLSQPQLADRYHVSHVTIGKILRKSGLPTRTGGGQYYPDELEALNQHVIQLTGQGLSTAQMGAILQLDPTTISERQVMLGLRDFDSGERALRRCETVEEFEAELAKIAEDYRNGDSVHDLKQRYGCGITTVLQALHQFKVPMRGRGEGVRLRGRELAAEMKRCYDEGLSYYKIGKMYGQRCHNTVRRMIETHFPEHKSRKGRRGAKWPNIPEEPS